MAGSTRQNRKVSARVKTAGQSGTALAIMDYNMSCPTSCNNRQKTGWGGARNRRDRVSYHLTAAHVELLVGAWHFAEHVGLALNRHMTIHFGRLGLSDNEAAGVITAFLKTVGDRCRKAGLQFAAIWVRENGDRKGSHVHIFAHIPPSFLTTLVKEQRRWLRIAANSKLKAGSLRGKMLRGGVGYDEHVKVTARVNGANVARYVVKGTTADVAQLYWLTKVEYGGAIIGKRCGTTQNIGRAAWINAVWQPSFLM